MLVKDKKASRILVVSVAALIIAGSSVPSNRIPGVFELTPDKLIHCAEYFVFGFFLFNWVANEFSKKKIATWSVITLLLGSFMGVIDENYQRLTPGRTPDFWDWVLDTIGVILAIIFIRIFFKKSLETKKALLKESL